MIYISIIIILRCKSQKYQITWNWPYKPNDEQTSTADITLKYLAPHIRLYIKEYRLRESKKEFVRIDKEKKCKLKKKNKI